MKGLFLLFAIYLFTLTIVPCHDAGECSAVRKEVASHDHDGEDEQCPPFCACSCCGMVMAEPATSAWYAEGMLTPDYPYHLYGYVAPAPKALPTGVWQPPRIL